MRRSKQFFIRTQMIALAAMFAAALATVPAHAWTYKVIHDFCSKRACADGAAPEAGLLLDTEGDLYGTTNTGGTIRGAGTVFELVPQSGATSWKIKTLHAFKGNQDDGGNPEAALIMDSAGNLYGTTFQGGVNNTGAVFELLPNGLRTKRQLRILYFGENPLAALSYNGKVFGLPYDGASALYGTGFSGDVFSLVPNGGQWNETTLYKSGPYLRAGILVDPSGNLFGDSYQGGDNNSGRVFELVDTNGNWSEATLYDFCSVKRHCADGAFPAADLAMDSSGVLFGTTSQGGDQHKGCCGVIFQVIPNGENSQYNVLYNFCALKNCKDGAQPWSDLIFDSSGNLYGTTKTGGTHLTDVDHLGGGTVFRLAGSTLETLHAFCSERECADGEYPIGGVVMDPSGDLFGTTSEGGKYGAGVVYEISP